jgi:outer membrane receptor for ferrienterochelin and colicins
VCFPVFIITAYSQDDTISAGNQMSDTIGQVVVTGQFRAQPMDKSIYKIEIIDAKEIEQKASVNLGELLKTRRGFNFHSADLLGDFIRIRGLTGEHIKILIDGMPVTGRVYDRIDFGQLTLQNVDHIEIIEGPMSILYGSNALAGVINIITKDHLEKRFKLTANAYYETIGRVNFGFLFSRQIKKHSSLGIQGSRNFFDGWSPVDSSRYKTWKPKLQYTSGLMYKFNKKDLKLTLNTDLMHEELRDPGALTLANLYEKALDGYHYTTRLNNRLNFTNIFHENFVLNLQTGYSFYRKRRITYLNDLVNLQKTISSDGALHDTTSFHLISARGFASNITGRKFEYQTGFDFSYESALGKHTSGRREVSDISGFMNIIYRPVNRLSLQPGLRLMANSNYKAPLIYGMSMKFDPGKLVFKASYARGFRAPSLRQLYLQFIDNNHHILGNENLKAETADNVSISVNYSVQRDRIAWSFDGGLFYNAIENAIQLALSKKQPGLGQYFNVEGTLYKTKGAELGITFRRSPGIMVNAGVISTGKIRLDKTDKFSWSTDYVLSSTWHIKKYNLNFAMNYKYTDEYLEFAGNYDAEGTLDAIGQELTADYHLLDASLSKAFFSGKLNVTSGLKNIMNVKLVNSKGDINIHGSMNNSTTIGYGRTFFISTVYTFTK